MVKSQFIYVWHSTCIFLIFRKFVMCVWMKVEYNIIENSIPSVQKYRNCHPSICIWSYGLYFCFVVFVTTFMRFAEKPFYHCWFYLISLNKHVDRIHLLSLSYFLNNRVNVNGRKTYLFRYCIVNLSSYVKYNSNQSNRKWPDQLFLCQLSPDIFT